MEVRQKLDFAGLKEARWQLWAEAYSRYVQQKDSFWEIPGATEHAEQFEVPNPLKDAILGWLESQTFQRASACVRDGVFYFTMRQLMEGLGLGDELLNPNLTRSMSAILMGAGCERGNSRKEIAPGVAGRHYTYRLRD